MKINRLDAHDRYQHLTQQGLDIGKTCQKMIDQRPFGDHAFYIFSHNRQIALDERIAIYNDDLQQSLLDLSYVRNYRHLPDVPTGRLIWQPRLTKPKAQPNSMLFKAYPGSDNIKVIWMLPPEEMWEQYKKGNVTENKTVVESIYDYRNNRMKLEHKEDDDLSDDQIAAIYASIGQHARRMAKPQTLGAF